MPVKPAAKRHSPARLANQISTQWTARPLSQVIPDIERGLDYGFLQQLHVSTGLTAAILTSVLGITSRTIQRRKVVGRFSPEESERLWRIAFLFRKAEDLFEGSAPDAARWLTTPREEFAKHTPLEFARTEPGARAVESLIGRLEHGVFS